MKALTNRILMHLALFVLLSYAAFSKPISLEEAKEIAMQHNLQMNKYSIELQDPSAYKLIASSHDIFSNSTQNPTFYIYNFPQKGWVIVAGDDIARPILAYSKEGSYSLENLPDAAKYWLEIYDSAISETIKQGAPQSEKIANEWLLARNPKKRTYLLDEVVPPLIKTKWGQSSPYNDLCPYDEEAKKRTVTGNLATVMAQIMKYWNFPANGRGKNTYTHNKYGDLHADFENTTYDWDNMVNEYNENSTEEQKRAVATLMYHCGVALSMNYGIEASVTVEDYIASFLKIYFMYDNNAKLIDRYEYNDNTWKDILRKNLDNSQPIPYSGGAHGIRHSFICDGYDTDGRFHFNLGWNGMHNGYYYIDCITSYSFDIMQNAIIDIKPIEEFKSQISLLKPLELKQEIVYQNSSIKINANIVNNKAESFSGNISLRLFDAEDNFLMTIAEQKIDNLEVNKPTEVTFETDPLFNTSVGKYYIKLYDKHDMLNQWLLSSGDNKLEIDIQKALSSESKLSLYSSPILSAYQINKEKENNLKVTASFINTSETDFKGVISASIYNEKGTIIKELASYNVTEAIAPNNHIKDIEFSNTISDLDYGIYFIGFRIKDERGDFSLVNTNNFISFIKFEIVLPELITDTRLKNWIRVNTGKLPGVVINKDGGIIGTTINLEALAKIDSLNCTFGNLISIDELIRYMPNLKSLKCYENYLITLDASKNIELKYLQCSDNQLTNLDISNSIELRNLRCYNNQLTNLDISNNIKLEELSCNENQLNELDVSRNIELKYLDCSDNQLTNLNVSKNIKITHLNCTYNQLTNLDMSKNIELEDLYCYANQIANLDISKNIELKDLNCSGNKLNNLDISKNIELKYLYCSGNKLTDLDVSKNIKLTWLYCSYNQLTNLDISKNIKITELFCNNNMLNSLNVNTELTYLQCSDNQLTNLDMSKSIKLRELHCYTNQLTNLNVSENIELQTLYCVYNQLANLDVSKNIKLQALYCNNNMLNSLDVRPILSLWGLKCCNQGEGFTLYLTNKQKSKFTEANYCDAILHPSELITSLQLKNWIKLNAEKLPEVAINADGGITGTTTNLEALAKIDSLNCTHFNLVSIDELISHMPSLKTLQCYNTSLIELDVSKNINLKTLSCYDNQITNLNLTKNIKLEELYCDNNKLNNLDLSKNSELTYLKCNNNQLTNLNVSKSIKLEKLLCYHNQLNKLDLSKSIELTYLRCHYNQLINLDIGKNIKLEELYCDNNQINELDVSKNTNLELLYCKKNMLNSLDISPLLSLGKLHCCNQAEGFILYLTSEQKNKFTESSYCDAILKVNGSICEIEWLDIYPNPTAGKFVINSKFISDEIKILNLAGEVLYSKILNGETAEIDISNLPAGVYLVITKGKIGKVIKN